MAAEIEEITDSNQKCPTQGVMLTRGEYEHLISDLHQILALVMDHDALLTEFRPLLNQFRTPLAAASIRRRNRGRTEVQ